MSQLYVPELIKRDYPGIYRPQKWMVLNTLHGAFLTISLLLPMWGFTIPAVTLDTKVNVFPLLCPEWEFYCTLHSLMREGIKMLPSQRKGCVRTPDWKWLRGPPLAALFGVSVMECWVITPQISNLDVISYRGVWCLQTGTSVGLIGGQTVFITVESEVIAWCNYTEMVCCHF